MEYILRCPYCGKEYQHIDDDDKTALLDHAEVCEKNPLTKAETQIKALRKQLLRLTGDGTQTETNEKIIRALRSILSFEINIMNSIEGGQKIFREIIDL